MGSMEAKVARSAANMSSGRRSPMARKPAPAPPPSRSGPAALALQGAGQAEGRRQRGAARPLTEVPARAGLRSVSTTMVAVTTGAGTASAPEAPLGLSPASSSRRSVIRDLCRGEEPSINSSFCWTGSGIGIAGDNTAAGDRQCHPNGGHAGASCSRTVATWRRRTRFRLRTARLAPLRLTSERCAAPG